MLGPMCDDDDCEQPSMVREVAVAAGVAFAVAFAAKAGKWLWRRISDPPIAEPPPDIEVIREVVREELAAKPPAKVRK